MYNSHNRYQHTVKFSSSNIFNPANGQHNETLALSKSVSVMYTVTFNIGVLIQPCIQSTASFTQQNQPWYITTINLANSNKQPCTLLQTILYTVKKNLHASKTTPLPYQPLLYIGSIKHVLIMSPSTGNYQLSTLSQSTSTLCRLLINYVNCHNQSCTL